MAARQSGLNFEAMNSSLSSLLVSLIQEHSSEPKEVLIPSMVAFLMEAFPFLGEKDAILLTVKAYEIS